LFDAFSLREPESTSLENALAPCKACPLQQRAGDRLACDTISRGPINFSSAAGNRLGTVTGGVHYARMRKGDVICPECNAGFRRIELASRHGTAGEFHCPLCDHVLEVFDGSTEIAYRLTVAPEKLFE
jgi:hypothetical protein